MKSPAPLKKAIELLEMIQFIMRSEKLESGSESLGIPFGGIKHSLFESLSILKGMLADNTTPLPVNESSQKVSYDESISAVSSEIIDPATEVRRRVNSRNQLEPSSSGLAGRIRPVPEEVRGRVRELVDMIESDDLSR